MIEQLSNSQDPAIQKLATQIAILLAMEQGQDSYSDSYPGFRIAIQIAIWGQDSYPDSYLRFGQLSGQLEITCESIRVIAGPALSGPFFGSLLAQHNFFSQDYFSIIHCSQYCTKFSFTLMKFHLLISMGSTFNIYLMTHREKKDIVILTGKGPEKGQMKFSFFHIILYDCEVKVSFIYFIHYNYCIKICFSGSSCYFWRHQGQDCGYSILAIFPQKIGFNQGNIPG